MARKPRLEFEGAFYHVINRGNYRRDVFETAATAQAFERCLFETCERLGWRLHAYVVMRNHFHLALETPRGNLVAGMHWLQGTFATRFNRFRTERGHLFQSRYQAILVEPGPALASVVNYIHLNPVRAGIVPLELLVQFRWSSYRRFLRADRPAFLACADWLRELGGLDDTPAGWVSYAGYLAWLATDEAEQKRQAFDQLTRGWALGSAEFRARLVADHQPTLARHALPGTELKELRDLRSSHALDALLKSAGKTRADAADDWKAAPWKVALARELRRRTPATNAWIARELHMGRSGSVAQYLSQVRRGLRAVPD
jgi:REP element-mobilizing transposase RayT